MTLKSRVHNFSSGPSILPMEVLEEAARDLVCHPDLGLSIMELSHRTPAWQERINQAEADLRELLVIPDDYAVLFLQGGASLQFAMVPLNLAAPGQAINFIHTGRWSERAINEIPKTGRRAHIAAESKSTGYDRIPTKLDLEPDAAYVHYVSNNTIYGTEAPNPPDVPDSQLLVCDASSNILSRPIDVKRHALIFAGAQKNIGPAGLTLAIVRRDLLDRVHQPIPTMLSYKTFADAGSMYNTPPVWAIYVAGLTLKWIKRQGGMDVIEAQNAAKAELLYNAIDEAHLFRGWTVPENRSRMNLTFRLETDALADAFLKEADANNLKFLKGHRSVGGCRAALYNAMPLESVQLLADFIKDFDGRHAG